MTVDAESQASELPRRTEHLTWSSGPHDGGKSGSVRLATADVLTVPGVPWMQLQFRNGRIGRDSRIEITSLLDGATQVLDAATLKQWRHRSAYFNGDQVEIRLYVGSRDKGARVEVSEVIVGERGAPGAKSICGSDNRFFSLEPRVARIDPIGCTAWTVDNGQLLTAGHCLARSGNTTLSFNPPISLPDGTVQFPPPADQYSIDQTSFHFVDGGIGNDWGIFEVFNNPHTGLQPFQAQGGFSVRQDLGPANIRITGFGIDSGTANQANQTHVGPNAGSSGIIMRYVTDTMPGNSGSPVIDEATGVAVGIHTHGGCTSTGGNNHGTSFFNAALWNALDPVPGAVCTDQVPALSGHTSAVSTSGVFSSSNQGWLAFDSPRSSMWLSELWETPAWIAYDFGSARVVSRYTITNTNGSLTSRAPKDFTLQGWNGSSWVTVDSRTNQVGWVSGVSRSYNVASPGRYSRYRLHITDDNDARSGVVVISIGDLTFESCACTAPTDQVPTLSGDTPAVSTSGIYSSSTKGWLAFDSPRSSMWLSEVWETPAWIAYDWGASQRLITRYDITNTNGTLTSRAPRDFRLQGNNGSGWVTVDTRTGQSGWVSGVTRSFNVAAPGFFSDYRLYITDDNDSRSGVVVISIGDLQFVGCR